MSIKDVFNKDKNNQETDEGNEKDEQRTYQNFLAPDGKKIDLEGVDEKDSI